VKRGRSVRTILLNLVLCLVTVLTLTGGLAQAAPYQELDLSFSVTSHEPPVVSSSGLAGGEFSTGVNEFSLDLSESAGSTYDDVSFRVTMTGLASQKEELRLEHLDPAGSWEVLVPAGTTDLVYTVAAGDLAAHGSLSETLRLFIGAGLRGQTLAVKVAALRAGTSIPGAEADYSLVVTGPSIGLGEEVPGDRTFGIGQAAQVDLELANNSSRGYSGLTPVLTISGVPTAVPISGANALTIAQDISGDGRWEPVSLIRDTEGNIVARLGPPGGINLAGGEAACRLPLKITWPAGSAGAYTWTCFLIQDMGTEIEWSVAQDGLGDFTVANANPAISLSAAQQGFGPIPVGERSATLVVTVTNTGNVPEKIQVWGSDTSDGKYKLGLDFAVFVNYGTSQEFLLSTAPQFIPNSVLSPGESLDLKLQLKPLAAQMVDGTYHFLLRVEAQVAQN
jgi:hypothetical protein